MYCLLPLALLTAALTAGRTAGADVPGLAKRPNVLLVLSDDHSAAHVGCYGNPDIRTPSIDAFAKQAMRFDRYHVTCPQCVPSRAALMTGRNQIDIRMTRFSAPLPMSVLTYPEALRKAGYFTGVAGRSYHLDGAPTSPESRAVFDKYDLRTFPKRLDYVKTAGNRADMLGQYREFLDAATAAGKPWMLQLCFSDPHRAYTGGDLPHKHDPAKLKLPPFYPDTKLVREDFAAYYDEIGRFDADVGTVLAELDRRKLADDTLVIVSGDNGSAQFRGKGTLYDFGIHVPFLVRWPGQVKPGTATAELVSGEDVAPTVLEACGVPVPPEMTGKSVHKLLTGGAGYEGRKYVFAARGPHGSGLPTVSSAFDLSRCVVSRTHKLIYNPLWQIPYHPVDFAGTDMWRELEQMHRAGNLSPELSKLYFAPTRPMFEVYDLTADPAELRNLAGTPAAAGLEKELKAALQEWMILVQDHVPLPVTPEPKGKKK